MTDKCVRKDPSNVHNFPLHSVSKYSNSKPRNPDWHQKVKDSCSVPSAPATTPVSNQTAAEMRAFSTLRTLADINDTYARASRTHHRLGKNIHGPCDWCGAPNHDMYRCFAKDPENLFKYPHSHWINGQPPENMRRKYYKKHT
jgi:hypothetical protein